MFWEGSEDICYQESEILKCRWINKCDSANFMVEIRNWTTELGKHATSTLKDDEHYTHSAYLQGGYQKKLFISFLELFLQSSTKELRELRGKTWRFRDSWKKYSMPLKVTFTSVNLTYNGKSKTVVSKKYLWR